MIIGFCRIKQRLDKTKNSRKTQLGKKIKRKKQGKKETRQKGRHTSPLHCQKFDDCRETLAVEVRCRFCRDAFLGMR
jgi:hypothetical protein